MSHKNYDVIEMEEIAKNNISKFNNEQLKIFNIINNNINAENHNKARSRLFFIDGLGGCGKTFLYNTLLAKVRSANSIAIATASSGIAALLLHGGNTEHSTFKIPTNSVTANSVCNISLQHNKHAELIRRAKLIVRDEAPMASKYVFEAVDRTFRD
jgi:ATP-dependent DNA helicase PIF1